MLVSKLFAQPKIPFRKFKRHCVKYVWCCKRFSISRSTILADTLYKWNERERERERRTQRNTVMVVLKYEKMGKNDIRKWMKRIHTPYTVYMCFCNVQFEQYMRRWHWYIWMRVSERVCVCLFMSNHYDGVRFSAVKLSTAHLLI